MSGFVMMKNTALKAEQQSLNTQIANASYIEEVVAEYNAAKADEAWVLQLDSVTTSNTDDLVALIEELEEKMPTSITVITFSATNDGVSMNITVDSKAAAADVVSQLRTFSSIDAESIAISTISDVKDDMDIDTVSLSVSFSYAVQEPVDTEESAEAASDATAEDSGSTETE
jgi:type IV pilus assembly protein PilM